jgi:MFS family permease
MKSEGYIRETRREKRRIQAIRLRLEGKEVVIFSSAFLVALGVGTTMLGMVFHFREALGATPGQVGSLSAVWSLFYILGCIFMRPIFQKTAPRFLMLISTSFMFLFLSCILFVKDLWIAYVLYSLYGFAESFFWPSTMGWLSRGVEGSSLGKKMSMYNLSWSMGMIIGPLASGLLSAVGTLLPLIMGCGTFLLTSILILIAGITFPEIREEATAAEAEKEEGIREDKSTFLRFPSWVGLFTTYVVIGLLLSIFPIYGAEGLLFRKGTIGFLLQIRALCATAGFILLGRTAVWHFKPYQILGGQLIMAMAVFLMRGAYSPLANGILIAFIGFCMALSYFNSIFHGVSGSIQRAGRMAIHEAILSAGLIIGSSVGGLVYQRSSMQMVYTICTSVVVLGLLLQGVLVFLHVTQRKY